jgi:hypothetical protein
MEQFNVKFPHYEAPLKSFLGMGEEVVSTHRYDEDGSLITRLAYSLFLEADDGARYFLVDLDSDKETVEAAFVEWAEKLAAGEALDLDIWVEGNASYGSLRYQRAGGEEYLMAFEAKVESEHAQGLR